MIKGKAMEQKFYNVGDSVEREIDGSWFVGEVRVVNAAGNEIDERSYDIYYSEVEKLETNVPESELRISDKITVMEGMVILGIPTGSKDYRTEGVIKQLFSVQDEWINLCKLLKNYKIT